MTTKAKPKTERKEYERTIELELFNAWKEKRRKTDVEELVTITGKSTTIIYRALQFGHVKDDEICDTISNFYIERTRKQREQANLITGKTEDNG